MLLFPIGTDRQLRGFPWVTISLITANLFVFLVLQRGPEASNLPLVWSRFEWWMPITYMFAHADILHLAGNMVFLWVFGPHAEDALGRGRFILVYLSAGLTAGALHVLASIVFYPEDLAVGLMGASGAIMGIVSLFVLRYHGVRVRFFFWWLLPYIFYVRALWVGIAYLALDLLWGLVGIATEGVGGVAHWAHVGGFLAGGVWAWALRMPEEGTHEIRHAEAQKLARAGAWQDAVVLLEERISERPGDAELHAEAAACYEMMHEGRAHALRHWNEHLRLLLLAHRYQEAIERFRALTREYRPHEVAPAVLMRIGTAAEARECEDLALAAWMAVVQAHPHSPQAPSAALRAARLLSRRGKNEEARSLLQHLTTQWPDTHEALTAARLLKEMVS